jgi:hypothetical protein
MALPSSGALTLAQIQAEFGGSNPASLSEYYAGGAYVPAGTSGTYGAVPSSGAISIRNFYGTAQRVNISYTFTGSVGNASLNIAAIGGYIAGLSNVTVVVNPGVYLYATSTGSAGLSLFGGTTGDTLTLVNYGYIMGQGGAGGNGFTPSGAGAGGPALSIGRSLTINNTYGAAFIAGGGGGGASRNTAGSGGGGGGAGGGGGGPGRTGGTLNAGGGGGGLGGVGGTGSRTTYGTGGTGGGSGGGGGTYGQNAKGISGGAAGGGGGGRILPGTGGSPNGGTANAAGGSTGTTLNAAGGGGWGAAGGNTTGTQPLSGGAGGRAVQLNGNSVAWVSGDTTRVYGAVS